MRGHYVIMSQSRSSIKFFRTGIKKLLRNFRAREADFLRDFQGSILRMFLIKISVCVCLCACVCVSVRECVNCRFVAVGNCRVGKCPGVDLSQ